MTGFADLHRMHEDDRITLIGQSVMSGAQSSADRPLMNAFIVESNAKADRYVAKLLARFPDIRIIERGPGITPGTIMVRFAGPLR